MMGEELHTTFVTDSGLLGDRTYAVIDQSTGKVASAKHPRKWGKLFDFRAAFLEPPHPGEPLPPVRLTLPDGTLVSSAQDTVHAVLSRVLVGHTLAIGDEVRLRITDPMPRCVMTTLAQGDLPQDLGILHTVAQHNRVSIPALRGEARPSVGVCAFVSQGGTICRGDPVRVA
jgi:uncharacterized protein YcbX